MNLTLEEMVKSIPGQLTVVAMLALPISDVLADTREEFTNTNIEKMLANMDAGLPIFDGINYTADVQAPNTATQLLDKYFAGNENVETANPSVFYEEEDFPDTESNESLNDSLVNESAADGVGEGDFSGGTATQLLEKSFVSDHIRSPSVEIHDDQDTPSSGTASKMLEELMSE